MTLGLGAILRALRKEKRKTLRQVNDETGIDYSNLAQIEREEHDCNSATLNILANYYGVTTDYLLGKTDNPNSVIIKVADADGLTEVQHQLLDATKGLTADDLIEVNKYIEFIKSKKGNN